MGFDNISPNTLNAYLELSKKAFAYNLAAKGRQYMDVYQFPVEAMVACGCFESGWGTSPFYLATNCPFNLQRPVNWEWPHCDVYKSRTTGDRAGTQKYVTTFCKAIDLADSVRIFCEWIIHWPNSRQSGQLMAAKGNSKLFASKLPLVGFGSPPNPGADYVRMVDTVMPIINGPEPVIPHIPL